MTQPPTPQPGQPFDPNKIPTDPQQAAAWAQQQQAAAWQQHAAWQQQAAQEAQEEAHQEYLEQQAAAAKKPAFGGVRGIISLVVGLVVVAAAGWGIYQRFVVNQTLQAGNCMVVEGKDDNNLTPKQVECGKEDFSWKITQVVSDQNSCPADSEGTFELPQSGRRGTPKTTKVACLVPVFKEGKCYNVSTPNLKDVKASSCTTGDVKINKVINDPAAVCEIPEQTVNYTSDKVTYCVEPVA